MAAKPWIEVCCLFRYRTNPLKVACFAAQPAQLFVKKPFYGKDEMPGRAP